MLDILASLGRIVNSIMGRVDYFALYECVVDAQSADLTELDLTCLSKAFGGISRVPLRNGVPGVKVRVKTGARVLLGFDGGDPKKPYAALFGSASAVESLKLTTSVNVVFDTPLVELAGEGQGARLARIGDIFQASVLVPPSTIPQQVTGVLIAGGSSKATG